MSDTGVSWPPASRSNTRQRRSSDRRFATTAPADPPPFKKDEVALESQPNSELKNRISPTTMKSYSLYNLLLLVGIFSASSTVRWYSAIAAARNGTNQFWATTRPTLAADKAISRAAWSLLYVLPPTLQQARTSSIYANILIIEIGYRVTIHNGKNLPLT